MRRNLIRRYERKLKPTYWRLKHLRALASFQLKKSRFTAVEQVERTKEKARIFRFVFNLIAWQMLGALAAVLLLKLVDHFGYQYGLTKPEWINESAQLTFVTTLIPVSGALLGLYFTAISVVASTAYSRAPGNIRSLVIRERIGHLYFKTLGFLTATATVMAAVLSFNRSIGPLLTISATALSLYAIFGFVALGLEIFKLFDPTYLVPYLNEQLGKSIRSVTPAGLYFDDGSFQDHQRKGAAAYLGNYESLISIVAHGGSRDRTALAKLGAGLFQVLQYYANQKSAIATKSYWFTRDHGHKSWLLASHSELEVALQTSTTLRPENVPDTLWFERRVCDLLVEIIRKLQKSSETSSLNVLAQDFRSTLGIYGKVFGVDEGTFVFRRLNECFRVDDIVVSHEDFKGEFRAKTLERLSVVDAVGAALIEFSLGLRSVIENQTSETLLQAYVNCGQSEASDDWQQLPGHAIEEIEDLRQKISFEEEAYGGKITPNWYILERIYFRITGVVVKVAQEIVTLHRETFDQRLLSLIKGKNYFVATQLVQRGLESQQKCLGAIDVFEAYREEAIKHDRSRGYEWPQADWTGLRMRLAKSRSTMVLRLSRLGYWLSLLEESSSVSDYFGFAYTHTAEECFRALSTDDMATFSRLFPRYLLFARGAVARMQATINRQSGVSPSLIVDPLLDLMALSGYAAIYSDLYHKNFWASVTRAWNRFIEGMGPNAQGSIGAMIRMRENPIRQSPRDMVRFRWRRATEEILAAHGFGRRHYFDEPLPEPPEISSALLRVFAHNEMVDADTIFIARYLLERTPNLTAIPLDVRDFRSAMQRSQNTNDDEE